LFLIYDKEGYKNVSGPDTCKLMADSLATFLKAQNNTYTSYDTSLNAEEGFTESLRSGLQFTYSSECKYGALVSLCMVYWCVCVWGGGGCHKASVSETLQWMNKCLRSILTSGHALRLFIFVKILLLTFPFASLSFR
jgi:hypothetical protein